MCSSPASQTIQILKRMCWWETMSSDADDFARHAKTLDLVLNTVPVYHDYAKYRALLVDRGGRQVMLGLHTGFIGALLAGRAVGVKRSTLSGSAIGGVRATQEAMGCRLCCCCRSPTAATRSRGALPSRQLTRHVRARAVTLPAGRQCRLLSLSSRSTRPCCC